MAVPAKVTKKLDREKVKYEFVPHKTVFTVYDLAQTLKTKLNTIAKTLLVKADAEYRLELISKPHFGCKARFRAAAGGSGSMYLQYISPSAAAPRPRNRPFRHESRF
ncbi:MAG: hypothetical protein HYY50_01975 [Candidatus Kerfeldbacteria bacterium]|nr:hypothetical protein [Candidatus Kerfeldbacteria bacterium]